ncbi:UDP-Glycosyltransferase/glycogen phosphorylase [Mollisia scopiformis]|uniref:UDP-Glycosyltransferase/glycogen phosphorylase n=1 Tax=Mollisia scopiformis TaxID=149040 RepID=A0A132B933_MOLSC|nr:UDP-Glycosyltransferase/glycogen phosphorylase [Mollisia scopiformis]KUJ08881.1 UDP-Glycosyltransferase/glycogen phosphorylase [Mollisia scopiformis]
MADKSSNETHEEVTDSGIPASVIAQAEAAIIGEFEDEPSLSKRPSRVPKPDYSQYQGVYRSAAGESSSKTGNLQVPNILHSDTHDEAPPAYGDQHDQIDVSQDGFNTQAQITNDGRINININQKTRKLSDLLVPALRNQLSLVAHEEEHPLPPGYIPPALGGLPGQTPPPKLNVVIHVVGSRGDVQPFVALGKVLKSTYGHRVRLATHPTFKTFVEENGLEFFSIGGDPAELMAFMVKNPGLMPGFDSLKSGDVGKRRRGMEEIVLGCWRSCIEAGDGLGAPPKKDDANTSIFEAGINMDANPGDRPFIADAIIANPPSFAHVHIAEKMGIPLHMMFTMPWSPTQSFPHPLANIQSTNADVNMTNFVSYALVEMMTWQGLGDVINRFRERALGLEPISLIWAPGMLSRLRIPYTYCWSPALIPKPRDWGQHISISGFYFLSLASSYTPDPELAAYLAAGPPPVYIGFGSIVVDDPDAMTKLIFEAVKKAGVRALVSKGWGGLGADDLGIPDGVFMLGNVPHDWLFQHVSCVVHHGGAGTTAAGIATGKPTIVVPFFGDQPFWGAMVARAGAGPLPIPYKQLTSEKLAAAILEAIKPETLERAKELGEKIKEEQGCDVGGKSFHDLLDVDSLRCSLAPSRVAVWRIKRTKTRLSALAANVLSSEGLVDFADLKLYRSREYDTEEGPWDPISGGASALLGTIASLGMGVADFPIEIFKKVRTVRTETMNSKSTKSSGNTVKSPNGSGGETPSVSEAASRSASQVDLGLNDSEPKSSMDSQYEGTAKTSYESTNRSSSDTSLTETPLTSTTSFGSQGEHRTNSMRAALSGALHRSGSRSGSRERSSLSRSNSKDRKPGSRSSSPFGHRRRETKEFDPSQLTLENAQRSAKGMARIVGAGLKSPMDFTLGIARGFHNAPKLYGDDTVRQQEKVTDFQSGIKAATKEFGYGMFDGITGLVTQPLRGAEKEGAAGLLKGIGKGIGGLVLKPGAAIWGIPGYTFMGVHKEIRKIFGSSVLNYMIAARTAQGYEETRNSTPEERQDIINRWRMHKDEYMSSKMKIVESGGPEGQESGRLTPKGFMQTRHLSFEERKRLHEERKVHREEERKRLEAEEGSHRHCPFCRRTTSHSHTPRPVQTTPMVLQNPHPDQDEQFEHAIHASVAATSRGNAEEDNTIERAIRASVRELKLAQGSTLSDQEALERAIQASITEAARHRQREASDDSQISQSSVETVTLTQEEAEHQAALEKAIQASLNAYQLPTTDGGSEEEDENMKLALQLSKEDPLSAQHEKELELAIQKSKEDPSDKDLELAIQKSKEEKSEEEVVLAYVKKQSLLEEEHRAKVEGKKREEVSGGEQMSPADEEALRRAIEESMKGSEGAGSAAAG